MVLGYPRIEWVVLCYALLTLLFNYFVHGNADKQRESHLLCDPREGRLCFALSPLTCWPPIREPIIARGSEE